MSGLPIRLVPLMTAFSLLLLACGEEPDPGAGGGTEPTPAVTDTAGATATGSPTPTGGTASPTPTTGDTPTPTPTGEDTAAGTDSETVEVVGVDYAYEGVPGSVETGTELDFTNASDAEVHELVLVRLPEVEERSVEELLQLTPEEQEEMLADSVVGVSVAMPDEDGRVVEGDLVVDEPGRYLMVCFVPTGADPEAFLSAAEESQGGPPQVEGGPPHVANGMYAELTVDG